MFICIYRVIILAKKGWGDMFLKNDRLLHKPRFSFLVGRRDMNEIGTVDEHNADSLQFYHFTQIYVTENKSF